MTNAEIAKAFTMIGKILELQDENPFRIRAYDRAALTIESLPKDLAEIYKEGGRAGLREIPGIGEDLSLKIEELLKTGKLAYLAMLQKKVPPGVLAIMEIEGLGPKKVKFLWRKFKVQSVADLEKLAKSGRLTGLKGWGEKSVQNVLRGIGEKRTMGGRMPIHEAQELAEKLMKALQATKLCGRIEIAGSLRRARETVGDIDLLATSKSPAKLMEAFCKFPEVQRVLGKGPTKASVHLKAGVDADLRVLDDAVFGAAWHYFTGSKAHNVRLRTMAIKRGITISEYGVFKGTAAKKVKLLASRTEEDVYAALRLPWIPPEIREDQGEIEAAAAGRLPRLVEEGDIRGDLHVHSNWSDGNATIEAMAGAAKARGFAYIVISDHASPMGMVKGVKEGNVARYLKAIDAAQKAVKGIEILAGTEVDILADGRLYLPEAILGELQWVTASVHQNFRQTREEMTQRLLRAIENPFVRAIGHPTTRLLGKRPGVEFDVDAVFRAAAKHTVAMELNASVSRLDLSDVLCRRAKEAGVKIVIDSDAHDPAELEYRFGIAQARRAWLEKGDILNCLPLEKFRRLL